MMSEKLSYRPPEQAVGKEVIGSSVDVDQLPLDLTRAITSRAIEIMHRSNLLIIK